MHKQFCYLGTHTCLVEVAGWFGELRGGEKGEEDTSKNCLTRVYPPRALSRSPRAQCVVLLAARLRYTLPERLVADAIQATCPEIAREVASTWAALAPYAAAVCGCSAHTVHRHRHVLLKGDCWGCGGTGCNVHF